MTRSAVGVIQHPTALDWCHRPWITIFQGYQAVNGRCLIHVDIHHICLRIKSPPTPLYTSLVPRHSDNSFERSRCVLWTSLMFPEKLKYIFVSFRIDIA